MYAYHKYNSQKAYNNNMEMLDNFCKKNNLILKQICSDKGAVNDALDNLKDNILKSGDILVIPDIGYLGRRPKDIRLELLKFKELGIRLLFLDIPTTLNLEMNKSVQEVVQDLIIDIYSKKSTNEKLIEQKTENCGRKRIKFPANYDSIISAWESGEISAVAAMEELNLKKTTFYKLYNDYMDGRKNI